MCDPLQIRQEMGVTSVVQWRKTSGAQQEIYERWWLPESTEQYV